MTSDTITKVLSYIFRYVWIICIFILTVEFITTAYTANFMMLKTSNDMLLMTKNEVEKKIDITWKLSEALAKDNFITNEEIDLITRGQHLRTYNDVYNLFLIGVTDEKGIITSSYDDIPGDIGYRDYFQRVVSTGEPEITDVFLAGADGITKNYTICTPIKDDNGKVEGTIIMSIYYDEIDKIVTRQLSGNTYHFSLLDSQNIIMSEMDEGFVGKSFLEAEGKSIILGNDKETLNKNILNKNTGAYWSIYNGQIKFVRYTPIQNTNWSINVQTDVLGNVKPILIQFGIKSFLYIAIFTFISFFGKKYTINKLKSITVLIKQVTNLQEELKGMKILESNEISEFIKVSQSGLTDGLTGLPTRSIFLIQQKMAFELADMNQRVALLSIDLDNLKSINDNYGHNFGDMAIKHFGNCLVELYKEYECLVCRYGGDEFLVYIPFENRDGLIKMLVYLKDQLTTTIDDNKSKEEIHASIGVAIYPDHGINFDELYKSSDRALYEAKRRGKNQFLIFDVNIDK